MKDPITSILDEFTDALETIIEGNACNAGYTFKNTVKPKFIYQGDLPLEACGGYPALCIWPSNEVTNSGNYSSQRFDETVTIFVRCIVERQTNSRDAILSLKQDVQNAIFTAWFPTTGNLRANVKADSGADVAMIKKEAVPEIWFPADASDYGFCGITFSVNYRYVATNF